MHPSTIHHHHAVPHLFDGRGARQGDRVEDVKAKQGDRVQAEHADEDERVRIPASGESPTHDAELEEEPRPDLAERHQAGRPAMARRAHEEPHEHADVEGEQQVAVGTGGGQARTESGLEAAVCKREAGPRGMVETARQDEGGREKRRNGQQDHRAAGQPATQAGILEQEAGGGRHEGQLPDGHELEPEDLGVEIDCRRLEHRADRPRDGEEAGDRERQGGGDLAMTPAVPGKNGDQDGGDERRPEVAAVGVRGRRHHR